jgi:cell division protein FtsI (penicillin-binding protein 3)
LVVVLVLVSAWLVLIGARLGMLQVRDHEKYQQRASSQQLRVMELDPPRGTIYDSRGRELAVSVPVDSLYALPREIEDPAAVAAALAPVLGKDAAEIEGRLTGGQDWVWIDRKLDPPTASAVEALGLAGVGFVEESKRYYPMRELAAPLLGYVGTDDSGLRGLEYLYDGEIAGRGARRPVIRDNRGGRRLAFPDLSFVEATPGRDLYLTLDAGNQHVVEQELAAAVEKHRAKSGWAVILDPNDGAVLAMATYPPFDANRALEHEGRERIHPVADTFEPGSTFKVITAAAALEANLVDPSDVFDCEMGAITVFGSRIKDHHPYGMLTFRDVLAKSSNVGAIKIGMRVGARPLFDVIRGFGFGEKTGIDLPGEAMGGLRPFDQWSRVTPAYVSFGQGVSVTPIQLTSAIAAVANGGTLYRPYLVRAVAGDEVTEVRPVVRGRPISESTALQLERMLESVFEPGGTAQRATIPGYRLAGKTGTAQKIVDGRYSQTLFVPNFVGFAPARRPVIAGLVAIDEPRSGVTAGGVVAAPVFSAIARRVLPYLGVRPDLPDPPDPPGTGLASVPEVMTARYDAIEIPDPPYGPASVDGPGPGRPRGDTR